MMNSIFSMFDPMNKMVNPFLVCMILLMKIPMTKEKKKNKNMMKMLFKELTTQIKSNSNLKMKINSIQTMFMTIMTTMLVLNLLSLTPFSWSTTSQPAFNIPSVMSVMMLIIMITMKKNKNLLVHLTPPSTPNMLIPFMVMIELISWMARPLTLILRLTANMISGHILMFLMGKISSSMKMKNMIISMTTMVPLIILESMVSIIQAYILFTLMTLYLKET